MTWRRSSITPGKAMGPPSTRSSTATALAGPSSWSTACASSPAIAGVIASAPALVPSGVRHPILEGLGRVISPVWPTFGVHLPLEHAALSRQPETADRYDRDPLVHGRTTARAATESLAALRWTREHAGAWRLPLLLLHGAADRIISPQGSRDFAAAARAGGAPDVTLIEYAGGYHEPHNDVQAEQVMTDVEAWLDSH